MSTNTTFGTFFLPGPTEVRQEILAAMTQPMIPHRGSAFEQLFERLQHGLRPLFMTERPVYISSSSATGMMESAIRCAPAGRILQPGKWRILGAVRPHRFDVRARCRPV